MSRARNIIQACWISIIVGLTLTGLYCYPCPCNVPAAEEYTRSLRGSLYTILRSNGRIHQWLEAGGSWLYRRRIGFQTNNAEEQVILEDADSGGKIGLNDNSYNSDMATDIPDYVLDYAPLVHLYSGEQFWPSDIAEHLTHVTPNLNYTPIQAKSANLNLTNLDNLNEYSRGRYVYLKSDDDVEERPDWLASKKNIPNASAHEIISTHGAEWIGNSQPGRSDAPAVLIVINKGNGIVDAFWFYFYSYNLGNVVFNVRFGNHVGDWEHSLVRFQDGKPKVVFFSEHNFGSAYSYNAVEKIGNRVSSQHKFSSWISCS